MMGKLRKSKGLVGVVLAIGLLVFIFSQVYTGTPKSGSIKNRPEIENKAISFKKEGQLTILRNQTDSIVTIDIELANNPDKIVQGLMHRTEMDLNQGMLFIMPSEVPQSFWMKNTVLSLDIIFIDAQGVIGSVQKYTKPYSLSPLPSEKPAKYVLEVKAGFWDKYALAVGDKIVFEAN